MTLKSKYLRLSLTDHCNLSCYYCHKEGQSPKSEYMLTPDDIMFIVEHCLDLGFSKLKLTGGEPLLRNDIISIISKIREFPVDDLSMITNGVLLYEYASELKKAGLPRLNVSLQTLDPKKFVGIANKNAGNLDLILKGIDRAIEVGFADMKINFVYHSAASKKDFDDVSLFASERGLVLVLLPVLLKNPNGDDEELPVDIICNELFHDKIVKTFDFSDNEGINKRITYLQNGAKILTRLNDLSDITPFKQCVSCEKRHDCREGIFPIRILSDGHLLPCLEEGLERIDIRSMIVSRDADKFKRVIMELFL